MSLRTTWRLFLLVGLLGSVIWFVDRRVPPSDLQRSRSGKVLEFVPDQISRLQIERGELRVDCLKSGGVWRLQAPLKARAEPGTIDRILSVLEASLRQEVITAEQREARELTLDSYGLLNPRARLSLHGHAERVDLLIGSDAPLGASVYVKLASSDDIVATSRALFDSVPGELSVLRDRTLVRGTASRTSRLEIQSPEVGFIQLVKTDEGWFLQQPFRTRADGGKVARMLDVLYAVEIRDFVWDLIAEADVEDADLTAGENGALVTSLQRYGLAEDEAVARIAVWADGGEKGEEVIMGKEAGDNGGEIYAKLRNAGSVYTVPADILPVFAVTADDLRDRSVFTMDPAEVVYACFQKGDAKLALRKADQGGWMLVEPVQWKADDQLASEIVRRVALLDVTTFLDGPSDALADYQLDPPRHAVELASALALGAGAAGVGEEEGSEILLGRMAGTEERRWPRLLIGASTGRDGLFYAKLAGEDTVFEIGGQILEWLDLHAVDPLSYRDRTMLSVPSQSVRKLTVQSSGRESTVVREDSGYWRSSSGEDEANPGAIEDILFSVSNLRAVRTESHSPSDLGPYGLTVSGDRLTIGLTADEGIQKSVMIGSPDRTGGRYAMVQGQDVVFVLDGGTAGVLLGNVTQPAAGQGGGRGAE